MTKRAAMDQSNARAVRTARAETASPRMDLHELFDAQASYVWRSLRRLGVPDADLEDVLHDVFVQVHKHLAEYDPARPIKPWLFGFAFRVASQERRRVRRRRESPAEHAHTVDPRPLADAELVVAEERELVLAALESVDLDKRAVFVLYEIDDVAMSEIASSLGVPVNTAYSRLRLARADFAAAVKRLRARRGER